MRKYYILQTKDKKYYYLDSNTLNVVNTKEESNLKGGSLACNLYCKTLMNEFNLMVNDDFKVVAVLEN